MRKVADPKADEIAAAQLTVDSQVEHGQIADCMRVLKVNPDSPDVLGLQRWFLADELALGLRTMRAAQATPAHTDFFDGTPFPPSPIGLM